MNKTFNLGFILGRFQHLHLGHERMIRTALNTCEQVLLMVGSSQESMTVKNPFNLYTRMELIRVVFREEIEEQRLLLCHIDDLTDVSDNGFAWGDFVFKKIEMWSHHYALKSNVDCIITGNNIDDLKWYYREELLSNKSFIVIDRKIGGIDVSTTMLRKLLTGYTTDRVKWEQFVPHRIRDKYYGLRRDLLLVPEYKEDEVDHE